MRPWPEPGARKEEEAMKKLFALLMALTMTVQLVTPAWADAVEEGPEESTEAVEVVQETTEATEETEAPEETETETEETEVTEEVTEPEGTTEETAEAEPTEETEEALPEAGVVEDVAALEAGVVASGTCGENLSWVLDEDGVLTISGEGEMEDYSYSNVAPWSRQKKSILSLVIEEGVTTIGSYAFKDLENLYSVSIPHSVTCMKDRAFSFCKSLRMIYIPDTLTTITMTDSDDAPFYGCGEELSVFCEADSKPDGWNNSWKSISSYGGRYWLNAYFEIQKSEYTTLCDIDRTSEIINVPEGITVIPAYYFSKLGNVKRINLPETLREIGLCAFSKCTGLDTLYIPKSVMTIAGDEEQYSPFFGCKKDMIVYCGSSSVQAGWDHYWNYYNYSDRLNVIYGFSPSDMSYWDSVDRSEEIIEIPYGVECIPENAFANRVGLREIQIPGSVKTIRRNAFKNCSNLQKVTLEEGITELEYSVFSGCTKLEEIVLPNSIEEIGGNSFGGCTSLKSVTLPEDLSALNGNMFSGCTALTEIDLKNIGNLGTGAFSGCTGMKDIYIPATVTSINGKPFVDCNSKMRIYCGVDAKPDGWEYGWNCLNDYSYNGTLKAYFHVSKEAYDFWSHIPQNETNLVIPNTVDGIPAWIGADIPNVVSLYIPSSVKYIGEYAFSNHKSLKNVVIEPGVQTIGNNVFMGCDITSIDLPDTLVSMGESVFWFCGKLKEAKIPGSLTKVPDKTFEECTSLRNVTLGEGIEELGSEVFQDCSNISKLIIPGTVKKIGYGLVDRYGSTRLEYGGTMLQWAGMQTFLSAYCSDGYLIDSGTCGDLNVSIGEKVNWYITKSGKGYSLTIFGDGAIGDRSDADKVPWAEYRDDIVEATVMEGVTKIGECAFWGCTKLSKITLPESLEWINQYAFSWCHSLKTIAIPKNVDTIGYQAFWDCYNLTSINFLHEQDDSLFLNEEAFITQSKQVTTKIRVPDVKRVNEAIKGYSWKSDHRTVSYGYNDCLPKVEKITLWKDEQQINGTINLDIADAEELSLHAVLEPAGALQQVIWASSSSAVATVSNEGEVKLIKPGTTTISASTVDGSKLSARVTLNVIYLDGAKTLTLRSDAPAVGLQVGKTANLTLSGDKEISAEYIDFSIPAEQSAIASVDSNGTITAGTTSGTVTVTAALRGDPLGRKATLKLNVIPKQAQAVRVTVENPDNLGQFIQGETNATFSLDMDVVRETDRQFPLVVEALDDEGNWTQTSRILYTSSDSAIASIGTDGVLIIKKASSGECVIRIQSDDLAKVETQLRVIVEDKAPRLDSNKLTLNANLTAGTTTALVESYNNTIQSVTLYDYNKTTKIYESTPSETFTAEAEDGTLTVRALGAQSSGTYQLKLVVTCLGGSYDYTLQVKVANSLPKVTVKQIGKFDTFYLDSTAQLTATASGYEVERLKLIGADTFRMDEDGNLFYAESYNPGDKIVTKGTLLVYVEGYQVPVEKNVTVATTKTAPKLTLNPSASAVNRALEDPEFRVKVLWKGNALDLTDAEVTPDVGFATVEAQGQYLVFRLTGTTGGTAKLSLRLPGWAQVVSLTHKITVENKLPTVKLGTPTLKLNSLFSAQTARTSVWLTQGNLDISTMDFKAAREEGERIALSFDPETDSIEAKFKEMPKAGTYSYTYTAYLENGTALPSGTIKVTVAATAPKVKLSAASVKLNRYLAGQEKATVKVTLTGGTGYQVTDFEVLPDYMRYDAETSELTVVLPDETFTGKTCTLCPIVREEESGQEVPLPTKLTLKIQILNTNKLTVSLSAKGKLNTVDPDSAIAYTVTKVNNCLGTVESVDLVDQDDQDGDLFQVDLDTSGVKPIVLLRLLPGKSYATNKTYKVRFRFTVCGREVLSSVLSVKVTQTALKVTAPKTAVYYLSQSGPLRCSLKANLPLESVALSTRTAKEFQQALGGLENLRLTGNRVEFKLTNPGALTAGKSYSVQLELTPENAAENTKPTTIKLTVKVMK